MKNRLEIIGLASVSILILLILITMVFVVAFPKDDMQDAIAEDNMERAKVRAELYRSLD